MSKSSGTARKKAIRNYLRLQIDRGWSDGLEALIRVGEYERV
jgi:hypothetical protein